MMLLYGAKGTSLNGTQRRGGSSRCCVPQAYAVAARRLPLCPPSDHPASHAIVAASTVPAPRDQQASCDRRRDGAQEGVQAVPDRLLPLNRSGFAGGRLV